MFRADLLRRTGFFKTGRYNRSVKLGILLLSVVLLSCNRGSPQTKEAVRAGVVEHLTQKAGLDVSSMDVDIASLSFRGNEADALVSFRPKGSTDPGSGMQMKYTLEGQRGKWVVKGRAESGGTPHGGAGAPSPSGGLPPGHPPAGQGESGAALPPDHPPVRTAPPGPKK
jgi:hypothetical protein